MMNRERLQQMVTMLRELPEEQRNNFDLDYWSCGTSACAVGWACVNPVFTAQGLKRRHTGAPEYGLLSSWDAVEKFFELTQGESAYLFEVTEYPNRRATKPEEVAARIEEFIGEA